MSKTIKREWLRVGRRGGPKACPVCGHGDWCTVSADGALVHCMRVFSYARCGAGGWFHGEAAGEIVSAAPKRQAPKRQAPKRSARELRRLMQRWWRRTGDRRRRRLAARLGVSPESLERLGASWAKYSRAWAFPMHDGRRRLCGIRLRARGGRKWCVRGSRNGLFWPAGLRGGPDDPILLPEGPTDVAACLDLGFAALGRPSCSGGVEMVLEAVRRWPKRELVVVADHDEPKRRPDGSCWRPGAEGAEALAAALTTVGRRPRIIRPAKGKDMRDWLAAGATPDLVRFLIDQQDYWRQYRDRREEDHG